jgi:hypothetical protein
MAEQIDLKAELKAATDRVLASKSRKKLVVAGPGAGKTYLFRELLKSADGSSEQRLVLTFINTGGQRVDRLNMYFWWVYILENCRTTLQISKTSRSVGFWSG